MESRRSLSENPDKYHKYFCLHIYLIMMKIAPFWRRTLISATTWWLFYSTMRFIAGKQFWAVYYFGNKAGKSDLCCHHCGRKRIITIDKSCYIAPDLFSRFKLMESPFSFPSLYKASHNVHLNYNLPACRSCAHRPHVICERFYCICLLRVQHKNRRKSLPPLWLVYT